MPKVSKPTLEEVALDASQQGFAKRIAGVDFRPTTGIPNSARRFEIGLERGLKSASNRGRRALRIDIGSYSLQSDASPYRPVRAANPETVVRGELPGDAWLAGVRRRTLFDRKRTGRWVECLEGKRLRGGT